MKLKNLHRTSFFYTRNENARKNVIHAINRIAIEILSCCGDVISIILFGSFARSEGVWKKGERIRIISDLDLLVVTRGKKEAPKDLIQRKKQIEEEQGVKVDLNFASYKGLKRLVKNTHNFDRKEGITIWGKKVTHNFPNFKEKDINIKDIVILFFNRVFLIVQDFPLIKYKTPNAKIWLSHEASKSMFTCTDLICIRYFNYQSSITQRTKFVKEKSKQLMMTDRNGFIRDLDRAFDFRFKDVGRVYMKDAYDYWLRTRGHLLNVFKLCIGQEQTQNLQVYDEQIRSILHLSAELEFGQGIALPLFRRIKVGILQIYNLLELKRIPRFPRKFGQYTLSCRMIALMLYMSINQENLMEDYLTKAEKYLSKVYRSTAHALTTNAKDNLHKQIILRDKLRELHGVGICP